jgi:glycine/D-amino acid oxidase-like deaminating enzyme
LTSLPADSLIAGATTDPFWWRDAPPEPADDRPLPERVEVAVVGGGYCGLCAALELARAGVRVAVLDAGPLGAGASSRNGGMVGGAVRLDWHGLGRRLGPRRAEALLDGARASFEFLEQLIARERLDAAYERCGRFLLAGHPAQLRAYERRVAALGARAEGVRIVPRARQREEIGTDFYHGGILIQPAGALHPARFLRGLASAARSAGALLHAGAAVRRIGREAGGFVLATERGPVRSADVIIATNGYTGPLTPGLQRRVIPVSSYIIATEELPLELTRGLSPNGRMFVDERRLLSYFRLSPDRRRVLFGGRVSLADVDERQSAQGLYMRLIQVWPELAGRRISHSWKGKVAFTFDRLPHMGMLADGPIAGVHFAMGCNGSGVAMASYLGHQIALKLLGRAGRPCPFDIQEFPTRPFYRGRPWFLPAVGAWYRLLDGLDGWSGGRGLRSAGSERVRRAQ